MRTWLSILTLVVALPAVATTYYVATTGSDSNSGTQAQPWHTLTHAGAVTVPGDTIHVARGTYMENVSTERGGKASSRITYISDVRWGAKITGTGPRDVWDVNVSYVDVSGFDLSGDGCTGLFFWGNYNRAIGNNVHNAAPYPACSRGGAGLDDSTSFQGNQFIGNFVHDVGISDPLCGTPGHKGVHGIYQTEQNAKVLNNISVNNCGFGIHMWPISQNSVVVNNTIVNNRSGGILVSSDKTVVYNVSIRNNIVVDNGTGTTGAGIAISVNPTATLGTNVFCSNNLIFRNKGRDSNFSSPVCTNCIKGEDPLFMNNTGDAAGDYHLRSRSPAIGKGTSQDAPVIDIDGGARRIGQTPDIGAYEFGSPAAAWPWH